MPSLSLFGVVHVDRPSKVADELSAYAAGTDAVFIEWPEERPGPRTVARVAGRHPLGLLGAFLLSLLYAPLYLVATRRYEPAELVAVRGLDVPTGAVDRHPLFTFADLGVGWTLASWGTLLALVAVDPAAASMAVAAVAVAGTVLSLAVRRSRGPATALLGTVLCSGAGYAVLTTGVAAAGVLLASALGFVLAAGRTVEARNRHMLDRLADACAAEGYDEAVLVTGKGHVAGLVAAARERGPRVERAHVSRWLRGGVVDAAPGEAGSRAAEPASLGRRVGAGLVDAVVVGPLVVLAVGVTPDGLDPLAALATWFLAVPVGYFAALEATLGWTTGKQLLGLRVTDRDGRPASARAALVRNLVRPADALVGFVLLATDCGRLGDRLAGTDVRRL